MPRNGQDAALRRKQGPAPSIQPGARAEIADPDCLRLDLHPRQKGLQNRQKRDQDQKKTGSNVTVSSARILDDARTLETIFELGRRVENRHR